MTDPLWDEFDHESSVIAAPWSDRYPHLLSCADGDHTPTTIRPYGGPPIFTMCTTCGWRLPLNPDA